MITLKQIKEVTTVEGLEALGIGEVEVDISHRGGGVGFYASDVAVHFDVPEIYLPRKFGCGCNYLGGGIRGAIFPSGFGRTSVSAKTGKLLDALSEACIRAYNSVEQENNMQAEEYPDGETNWDNVASNASRKAGIKSAY